ncbi:GGDEF domain-containing protein [Parasedimentitalea psychrophila]|uniref:GGDEF domain-containing protein n=1 Tax=Parasedimentitalea psychrophila TaxID=2997337 RepID=A0A9Y2KZV5_9RHOB|nr:GGDEF domain-containing protein [Parasedimentitalea psychrophila]WIY25583.1 GGDEF domain-containing protein [Parasedimentitalea psychrophila]
MICLNQLADMAAKIAPMHVLLDLEGRISRVGPTLQKLRADQDWIGRPFLEVFDLLRPRYIQNLDDLLRTSGAKLHLKFRDDPQTGLKGVLAPLPGDLGAFVNLSFGISVLDAVRDYDLTSADFSATDLTIEMLYLVEAKSAAMEASRQLNLRLQGAKIAAEEQAYTDTLTGLKNRRAMDHILERMISTGRNFSVMQVDLDFFKAVNDSLGHAAGDTVLQKVASIMVECTRSIDTVARVGGDEFVLIIDNLVDRDKLGDIAKRLIGQLEEPIPYAGQLCRISGSIGTALSATGGQKNAAQLLKEADMALYAAKRAGRACHFFYESGMESVDLNEEADDPSIAAPVAVESNGSQTSGDA